MTDRPTFNEHDYFMKDKTDYTSRAVFQEHVRHTNDQTRQLRDETEDLQQQTELLHNEMRDYHGELDAVIEGDLIQTKVDERVEQKYTDLNNEYNTELNRLTAQLAQKVGGGKKAELEDLSADVLGSIDGSGTFNLLSEPQDYSVSLDKFSDETRSALSNLFTFGAVSNVLTMPSNANTFTSDSTVDRVFIIDKPIAVNTYLYDINYRSLVAGDIKFMLLSKSGDSFTVIKEVVDNRSIGENTCSLNYHTKQELYLGWYPFQTKGIPYKAQEAEGYNGHWYQINGNQTGTFTPTHQTSSSLSYAIEVNGRPLEFVSKENTSNVMTVGVGKEYTSIMEAVNNAGDSPTNPVTIIVHPGIYEEVVLLYGERNISIVGTNRNTCILRDDSGLYENSPLRVSGNSYIENMTIIATHDNAPINWLPSEGLADKANWPAYAVHVDDSNGENGDLFLCHFHNCVFYSEQSAAAGCGTHEGQTLKFTSCEFESNVPDTIYNASSKSRNGALFLHARQRANINNQRFILKDCIVKSNKNEVFRLQSVGAEYDENLEMSFYNNILWSDTLGKSDSVFVNDAPQAIVTPDSFGNNVNTLNQ